MRRCAIVVSALLTASAIFWLIWMHVANVRMHAKLAELHARHERIDPSDFSQTIPDDQNAARYLESAANAISTAVDCPANSNITYLDYPPYPYAWHQLADESEAVNVKVFALARQARQFDRAAYWVVPQSHVYLNSPGSMPSLYSMRSLANVLGDGMLNAHEHGNDAEAIERGLDLLRLKDAIDQSAFVLVHRLVADGIEALMTDRLEVLAADNLQVAGAKFNDPPSTQPVKPVQREVLVRLIQQLEDERIDEQGKMNALLGERMSYLNMMRESISRTTVLRPLLKLQAVKGLKICEDFVSAAMEPNLPRIISALRRQMILPGSGFFGLTLANQQQLMTWECRVLGSRRAAVIVLAARLYRCDHRKWPAKLEDLVPEYLKGVPHDPMIDSEGPISYVIQNEGTPAERPMLRLGPLAAGGPTSSPTTPQFGWQSSSAPNMWIDFSIPRSSRGQAADHNVQ